VDVDTHTSFNIFDNTPQSPLFCMTTEEVKPLAEYIDCRLDAGIICLRQRLFE
jgi:hypothetical protein